MRSKLINKNLATLRPSGYVTAANVSAFHETLTTTVNSKEHSMFLVDMRQVEFLDSAGLMALVTAFRQAQNLGKRFSICSLAPSVRIIFELTQLDKVFEIFDDHQAFELFLEEAIAA
jgi:anti-sigma B factor antagonist